MFSSMKTTVLVIVFAYSIFSVTSLKFYTTKATIGPSAVTFPWVGVLRVRPNGQNKEAVTGIIMIAKYWAMGNANEIAKINKDYLRNITQAMFLRPDGIPWQCSIEKYIIHPEFDKKTLNTIALIKLVYQINQFPWRIIKWPLMRINQPTDVYAIGFTDYNQVLEQVKYKMDYVNVTDCKTFYRKEKINFKSMWPVGFSCYTRTYSKNSCVYDAGLALATNSSGMWTLLGISTLGPGCALPARFIDFYRYVPWIESNSITRKQDSRRQAQGMYRIWQDEDVRLLNKVYTSELALRPYTTRTDTVYGRCRGDDGNIVYRDRMAIEVEDLETRGYGVAIFALTLYDLLYKDFTCISLRAYCQERSRPGFGFSYGFKQEDVYAFTKRVPFSMFRKRATLPRVHTVHTRWSEYDDIRTAWFEVKFQFRQHGYLELKIFGRPHKTTTTPPPTTSTTTPAWPRSTRTYRERWRPSPRTNPRTTMGPTEVPGSGPPPPPGPPRPPMG